MVGIRNVNEMTPFKVPMAAPKAKTVNIAKIGLTCRFNKRFKKFWICKNKECGKIYYEGIHWEKMRKQLEKVKNLK